jgi:uncharacterized delta-60 repeat protein
MGMVGRRMATGAAAAIAMVTVGVAAALAAEGDLDSGYGTGGTRLTDVSGGGIRDLALQGDGKVLAAGVGGTEDPEDRAATLVRYSTIGNPDNPNFGTFGIFQSQFAPPFAAGTVAEYEAVAVRPTGQVVAVGMIDPPSTSPEALAITQLTAAGAPDGTFSTDGVQVHTPSSGSNSAANDVAIAPDGDVVVVGETNTPGDDLNTVIERYGTDGVLENDFVGTAGFINHNASAAAGDDDRANAVAIDPTSGDIVVVGTANIPDGGGSTESDVSVIRMTSAGAFDSSFGGGDGKVLIDVEAADIPVEAQDDDQGNDVAITPEGKILITGNRLAGSDINHFVMQLEEDGDLDPTFGDDGDGVTVGPGSIDFGNALVRLPDGKIVVAGDKVAVGDMMAARYTPAGLPDTGFGGGDGQVTVDFGVSAGADGVVAQTDGKLVLGGNAAGGFALARLQGPAPPVDPPVDPPANPPANPPASSPAAKKKCRKGQKLKKGKCVKKKRKKR